MTSCIIKLSLVAVNQVLNRTLTMDSIMKICQDTVVINVKRSTLGHNCCIQKIQYICKNLKD